MYKHIIALFSCFVILFSCVPFAHAEYVSDNQGANFWDWAMIYGNKYGSGTSISGVVQAVTGWMSGKVCSLSPDSYHHSDVKPNAFGNGGHDDSGSYVWCTCKYCGDQFKLYTSIDTDHGGGFGKSDLQQSYDAQVEGLQNRVVTSGSSLHCYPTEYNNLSAINSLSEIEQVSRPSQSGCGCMLSFPDPYHFIYRDHGGHKFFSRVVVYFQVPVSGNYYISWPENVYSLQDDRVTKRGSSLTTDRYSKVYYPNDSYLGPALSSQSIYFDSSIPYGFYIRSALSPSDDSPFDYYFSADLVPDENYFSGPVVSADDIDSRPTSITGDYGIIGDNGQIIKVEGDKIVNETNNTYYNPSTGQTVPITDWSYNYEDRSYTVTTESGDTVTITYGDENVVIKEGDTTYNIYYLVDGSGSEDPGPDVPGTCNHQWAETSTTPATCTVPGSRLLTCSLCNETKTEAIPAPGHKWTIKQEVKNEYDSSGNQTQEGYTIWECSVCGEQQKTTDGTAPPGGGGSGSGSSGGVFSGIFGLLVDFLGFFWNTFRDFVGEGVKGFLTALMDGTSSIFGLLNPFNWGG